MGVALLLVAALLGAYVWRARLLHGLASALVVDEPAFSSDHVLLVGGDRAYDHAAGHYHSRRDGLVFLARGHPGRLEALEVVPSPLAVSRHELLARGVPPGAIQVLPGVVRSDWDVAREVKGWLRERPGERLLMLCDRFSSRRLRWLLDRVLGEMAPRVGVRALPHRDHDETDWWRHKSGQLDCLGSSLRLAFYVFAGEGEPGPPAWEPDDYERSLR